MTHNFWNRWFFGGFVQQTRRKQRKKPRRARPSIEQLETRALLSTVVPLETVTPHFIIASPQSGISPMGGNGPAGGYTPSQITQAYGFNLISFTSSGATIQGNGAGQTIAIVDAYNDPNISSDLQTFDAQFGLPNPTLTVIGQTGGVAPTATDPSYAWEKEESLDVEWAHAIAPAANIVLVEAIDASLDSLMTAANTAANLPGVSVVSMSWGGSEFSGETTYDSSYFSTPNVPADVAFIAAAGDNGAPPIYPGTSPNVLTVGGTTLTLTSSNNWSSETAWSGSGGGISSYEAQPSYQQGIVTQSSTQRTNPDVAYDADPNTGFSVYDSYPAYRTGSGWMEVGGTSAAAPQWAALVAIADQGRALYGESSLGYSQLLSDIYQMPASYFHDITSGSSAGTPSYSAGPGYDLVTGRGTPLANPIVNSLVGTSTYFVTSTADDGSTGTLRDAINQVNAGKFNEIDFNIAGTGVQTINLTSALPALTAGGVFINGYSENQFQGVTSTSPLLSLNGSGAGSSSDGLLLQGSNNTVSGLILSNFGKNGIEVDGSNNIIGDAATGVGNILSGNTGDGVLIDSGVSGVLVQGNFIGTNTVGGAALANSVGIEVAGSNNTIGGTTSGARNLISGNLTYGVELDSGVSGVAVQGNFIGTDVNGSKAVANGVDGVHVLGSNNTIGGTSSAARNVISTNTSTDVYIDSTASGVLVEGNYIGTDATGSSSLGIGSIGIDVEGSANTIGGAVAGAGNVISGNSQNGVLIGAAASGVAVQGNLIGTDATGTKLIGNAVGITVSDSSNTIGGTAAGAGNIISGNTNQGLYLNASGVTVQGNYIGADITGTTAVANSIGILVSSSQNTIGGSEAGAANVISGNKGDGVQIASGVSGVLLLGNYIGTDPTGTTAVANSVGVEISGSNNTIGAGGPGSARNVISGNTGDGVLIDSGASGVLVQGNYIGTNSGGTASVANSIGVEVAGNSNTVGSIVYAGRNVISGNISDGVKIDSGASGNQVVGSYVGINVYDNAAVGNSIGIEVAGSNNTLGASWAVAPNEISGNSGDGVKLDQSSSGNVVLGSYIGTNHSGTAAVANSVGIEDGGSGNTIGGSVLGAKNVISGNTTDGVLIDSTATNEMMQSNYIGLNYSASTAIANGTNGVEIQGSGNTIGGNSGTDYFLRNFISGNNKGDGVKIDSGASGNQVVGNFIGIAVSGTIGVANSIGVEIAGNSNTIGGTANGVGNVISGNSGDGVLVDSTATGNLVQGSFVGTDYTGQAALGNGGSGIEIQGSGNTVGAGNILSGNSADGLRIDASASGNLVLGSLIGLNLSGAGSNGGNGVNIAGNNNTIGGTVNAARNIISGNSTDGVRIARGASGNQVLGNYIGTNSGGATAVANSIGVEVAGTSNTVGGAAGARNVISGNTSDGVKIDSGASGNQVLGNYIGTNSGGATAVANSIGVEVAGNNNTIGSTVYAARNIISSNTGDGVKIDSGASGNQVLGDYIGVNIYDNAALGNGTGIEVGGSSNTLGVSWAVAPNVVSGNEGDGVKLDSGSSGNTVLGNYIGTNHSGTAAVANSVGIEDGGSGNIIGGNFLGAKNVISGNSTDGVLIDSTATNETMQSNYIGLNYNASTALANGTNGVEIQGAGNTIGGNSGSNYFLRNFISGNKSDGVLIDSGASGNQVQGNFIGIAVSGTIGVANRIGVEIYGNSNTVGGTSSGYVNTISGNKGDGVLVDSTGAGNVIQGSFVGTDYTGTAALGNSGNGIEVAGNNNTVGGTASGAGNVISGNNKDGVLVSAGSGNTISRNSIFANTGAGISLSSGANNSIAAPSLSPATLNHNMLTVPGSFTAPTANVSYVLEFFANPSGDAEGKIYLGSLPVTPTSTGLQTFTFTTIASVTGANPLITATLTDNTGDTSEFSAGMTVS